MLQNNGKDLHHSHIIFFLQFYGRGVLHTPICVLHTPICVSHTPISSEGVCDTPLPQKMFENYFNSQTLPPIIYYPNYTNHS